MRPGGMVIGTRQAVNRGGGWLGRVSFGELVDTERNFATMQLTQYAPTAAATKETQMSDKCRRVLDSLIGLWSHESCYSAPVGALITR